MKRGRKKKKINHKQKTIEKELAVMNAEMQRLKEKHCRSNYEEASLRVVTNRYNFLSTLLTEITKKEK